MDREYKEEDIKLNEELISTGDGVVTYFDRKELSHLIEEGYTSGVLAKEGTRIVWNLIVTKEID